MTDENKKLLEDLRFRVKQVMFLCDSLREENSLLKSDLQDCKRAMGEQAEQLERLREKYDSLKMARTITAAAVDVDAARERLSKLMREVDKCINLLNS